MKWLRSKSFLISLAIVICAGGTYLFLGKSNKTAAETATENIVQVKKGNIRSVVSGTAQFEAKDSQIISVPSEGTVKSMKLTRSMPVKAGDVLVELSDPTLESNLRKAQANYDQLQRDLKSLQVEQSSLQSRASISGKLTYSANLDVGSSVNKTTKIATISDLRVLKVKLPFNFDVAMQLKKGDSIDLAIDGFMLTKVGTITSIGQNPRGDGKGGKLLDIEISIVNDNSVDAGLSVKGTANIGSISVDSAASGTLEYSQVVNILAGVPGNVIKLNFKSGDMVQSGDTIALFSNDTLADDLVAKQTSLDQQKLAVDDAQARLDALIVKAPFDGVFSTDFVNQKSNILSAFPVGSIIKAGTQLGGVANPTAMQLPVQVDELDLPNIKTGMKADVKVDSLTGRTFTGEVSQVSTVGTTTNGVTFFTVVLSVSNPNQLLKYGMTGTAEILIQDKKDVIYLPPEALQRSNGKRYVTLKNADGTNEQMHEVKIGITSKTQIEITEGLKEGDKVVTPVVKRQQNLSQQDINALRQQFQQGGGQGGFGGGGAGGPGGPGGAGGAGGAGGPGGNGGNGGNRGGGN
ncbi:efflux RND transporter periplasmic adaptor subunit [Paenibacillus sp. GP183]|uniref:efflux RND transporter periplasmic adaptor subunit n=1 Tax=Paenibacillus sp. GP183 TaxID=1882751 RepID=UPI000897AAB4|nr:efflux RND transporter periplasmic adaptor subunit [Paenibacillus sp. GP183]SEB60276.1 HlyD family secretion protein [Paenibacillus sp. GP183]